MPVRQGRPNMKMNSTVLLSTACLAALAVMSPPTVLAGRPTIQQVGHCASCGVPAPSCGCDDAVHCDSCAPRCGCVCFKPIIPTLLRGVDRVLTGLFSCHCRPACCPTGPGCVDACGCGGGCGGGGGYEMMEQPHYGTPTPDVMNNPFQDDPVPPQARYRSPSRSQYRSSPVSPYTRSRVTHQPTRRPQRVAAPPRPVPTHAPQTRDRVAQTKLPAAARPVAAETKPRIVRVEYTKPVVTTPKPAPIETQAPRELNRVTLQTNPAKRLQPAATTGSTVPVNPLR
jgi:hypothetical protein